MLNIEDKAKILHGNAETYLKYLKKFYFYFVRR